MLRSLACLVSVIIGYSSNEKGSIHAVLSQALLFSDDVVVSYASRLLDGSLEDTQHIQSLKAKYPQVRFVEYVIDFSLNMSKQLGVHIRPTAFWHNLARWTAVQNLKNKEWVFVLDSDEVADGKGVKKWLRKALPQLVEADCYKMANYWYFKKPIFRATTQESSVLLVHHKQITKANVFGDAERDHIVDASKCTLHDLMADFDGTVLWHHFSWVRSKSGMKHKLRYWAHANDKFQNVDVEQMVDAVFNDNNVNDFVHKYNYITVNNTFGIQV